jgi:hypothetical protein
MRLMYRKDGAAHAQEQDRPDILSRRHAWFDGQLDLDPERLVFIDETEFGAARPGRPPTWPGVMAGRPAASGCA